MTTLPQQFRKPSNLSGYKYVVRAGNGNGWQASRNGGGRPDGWRGPLRPSPEAAILDLCAHLDGDEVSDPILKTAGHVYEVDEKDTDPEYQAALGIIRDRKAQRAGKKCYVYCITEKHPGGGLSTVKVGSSTNPKKRVAELQTGNPRPLMILALTAGGEDKERELHRKYKDHNVLQEWFSVSKELLLEFDLNADGVPFSTTAK